MALLNFTDKSQSKLKGVLGSFDTEIQERVFRSQVGYIENQYFKVTAEVEIAAEGGTPASIEYKAVEVQPNGTEISNGIIFDSDQTPTSDISKPVYLPNLKFNSDLFSGSVEVGKAYQVEEVDSDTFGEASDWYIIPKGGAGGGLLYAVVVGQQVSNPDLPDLDNNLYYINIMTSRSRQPVINEDDVAVLNMQYYSNYGVLPSGFTLSVFLNDSGIYEPLDLQTNCFSTVTSVVDSNNYDVSINTMHDNSGFDLGVNSVIAPNIGYGLLSINSNISVYFIKESNQWYIDPSTFGAI